MKSLPQIIVPIIYNGKFINKNLYDEVSNKRVVIFGLPGAFTPTCSEKHLPGYVELYDSICSKNIEDIFCLSVNDPYVMSSWLLDKKYGNKIKGIADGNGEVSKSLNLLVNKNNNFMGMRCNRFSLISNNCTIEKFFIEKSGEYSVSSAENILKYL